MPAMSNTSDVRRPVGLGIKRGLKHRCPNCGEGELFARYLKVNAECAACGHDLSQYRADDGPAYLTILLVGHLIVAPAFFFPVMWETSPWIIVPAALAALTAAVLTLLPRIKGGFIGLLWANRVTKDQPA
ncbi:hypothetical protein AMEJIAPC_00928 [Caulobacter sp. NIBR1757]|nr:hypothetical protein AMEJIAPC_00928 [Caulobacter sp. NIBR1757]